MKKYIRAYNDVFEPDFCNDLILMFEDNKDDETISRTSEYDWAIDYRKFRELSATSVANTQSIFEFYYARVSQVYDHYKSVVDSPFLNNDFVFEQARVKKYEANGKDQFGFHVDVGDAATSKRFLACFTYLNDVEEGGETIFQFDELDCTIKPKQGTMVLFPPMWMYPHKGMKPISNSKYIISTYLHYK